MIFDQLFFLVNLYILYINDAGGQYELDQSGDMKSFVNPGKQEKTLL